MDQLHPLHPVPRPEVPPNHISDLEESISTKGFDVDKPVPVARMPGGELVSLGGHHRVAAMQNLGEVTIPARVVDWTSISQRSRDRFVRNFPDAFSGLIPDDD
ncbi:MAG: ParB/Srx family N-terminal domain-containing protein [Myxococcales bacterium]|nr:ParB/Srx family N-terminal domain-containing protein [Myxococcales bacterium]